jgi:hypothetical protein
VAISGCVVTCGNVIERVDDLLIAGRRSAAGALFPALLALAMASRPTFPQVMVIPQLTTRVAALAENVIRPGQRPAVGLPGPRAWRHRLIVSKWSRGGEVTAR